MPWMYELRGAENRLVEIRSGFSTEEDARNAAQGAKRLVDCVCYPNLETLAVVVKESEGIVNCLVEMPRPAGEAIPAALEQNLKFPWQRLVQLAFREPDLENVPLRINVAERALSERLCDPKPFEIDERLAVGEALLSLRRLLALVREANEFSGEEDPGSDENIA